MLNLNYFSLGLAIATPPLTAPTVDLEEFDLDPTPDKCLFCDALLVENEVTFCEDCLGECDRDDAADREYDSQVEDSE